MKTLKLQIQNSNCCFYDTLVCGLYSQKSLHYFNLLGRYCLLLVCVSPWMDDIQAQLLHCVIQAHISCYMDLWCSL